MNQKFIPLSHVTIETAPKHDLETKFISINRYSGLYINRNLWRAMGVLRYVEVEVSGADTIRLRAHDGVDMTTAVDGSKTIRIPNEIRDRALGARRVALANAVRLTGELKPDGWWYFTIPAAPARPSLNKSRRGS